MKLEIEAVAVPAGQEYRPSIVVADKTIWEYNLTFTDESYAEEVAMEKFVTMMFRLAVI